jgi:hypothetical protein
MLIAKGILDQIFERKYINFEYEEQKFWDKLKDKIEVMPIKHAIKEIEDELKELNESQEIKETPFYTNIQNTLSKYLEIYHGWYNNNKNTKIWHFKELSREELNKMLNIDITPYPEKGYKPAVWMGKEMPFRGYTSEEFAKILSVKNTQLFEINGKWTHQTSMENKIPSAETFLREVGLEIPLKTNKTEKYEIFNNILFNFNLEEEDNKKVFSIALSDMRDSEEMFKIVISKGTDIIPLKSRFLKLVNDMEE